MLPGSINDNIVRTAKQVQTSNRSTKIEVIKYAPASSSDYAKAMYPKHIQQIFRQILDANVEAIHKEMQAGHKSPLLRPSKVYVIDSLSTPQYPFKVGFRRTDSYFTASSTEKIIAELSNQLIQHELQFVGTGRQRDVQANKYDDFLIEVYVMREAYAGGKIKRYFMSIFARFVKTDYEKTLGNFDTICSKVYAAVAKVRQVQIWHRKLEALKQGIPKERLN